MLLSLRVQTCLLSSVEFLCLFCEEWFVYLVLKSFSVRPMYVSSRSSYNSSSKRCNLCLREKVLIIYRPDRFHRLTNVTNLYRLAATEKSVAM